jgi:hypothetical protein
MNVARRDDGNSASALSTHATYLCGENVHGFDSIGARSKLFLDLKPKRHGLLRWKSQYYDAVELFSMPLRQPVLDQNMLISELVNCYPQRSAFLLHGCPPGLSQVRRPETILIPIPIPIPLSMSNAGLGMFGKLELRAIQASLMVTS